MTIQLPITEQVQAAEHVGMLALHGADPLEDGGTDVYFLLEWPDLGDQITNLVRTGLDEHYHGAKRIFPFGKTSVHFTFLVKIEQPNVALPPTFLGTHAKIVNAILGKSME